MGCGLARQLLARLQVTPQPCEESEPILGPHRAGAGQSQLIEQGRRSVPDCLGFQRDGEGTAQATAELTAEGAQPVHPGLGLLGQGEEGRGQLAALAQALVLGPLCRLRQLLPRQIRPLGLDLLAGMGQMGPTSRSRTPLLIGSSARIFHASPEAFSKTPVASAASSAAVRSLTSCGHLANA